MFVTINKLQIPFLKTTLTNEIYVLHTAAASFGAKLNFDVFGMTNAGRNSARSGVLFLMSTALVTSTAGHQHLISEQRSVMLVSTRTPALCLSPGSQPQAAQVCSSLKALGMCVINAAPLQGP